MINIDHAWSELYGRPVNEAGDKYSSSAAIILAIGLMAGLVKRHLNGRPFESRIFSKSSFFLILSLVHEINHLKMFLLSCPRKNSLSGRFI